MRFLQILKLIKTSNKLFQFNYNKIIVYLILKNKLKRTFFNGTDTQNRLFPLCGSASTTGTSRSFWSSRSRESAPWTSGSRCSRNRWSWPRGPILSCGPEPESVPSTSWKQSRNASAARNRNCRCWSPWRTSQRRRTPANASDQSPRLLPIFWSGRDASQRWSHRRRKWSEQENRPSVRLFAGILTSRSFPNPRAGM